MLNNNVTKLQIPRSFKRVKTTRTTTFSTGDVVPFFSCEIIPNDYFIVDIASVTNMVTPNFATMDTLYQHISFFYCPNRLVFDEWDKFYGDGKNNDYETFIQLYIPQLTCPEGGWAEKTVADYLGCPTKIPCKDVSALPFRMFAMIYNEYYRDEQRMAKALVSKGLVNQTGSNGDYYVNELQNGGKVPKACRLFDYFTGTKLDFQAGDPVTIPVGISAPVNIFATPSSPTSVSDLYFKGQDSGKITPLKASQISGVTDRKDIVTYNNELFNNDVLSYHAGLSGEVDLRNATGIQIRDLKKLLMLQQELQNLEDGGTRYIEQLNKRWGVHASELQLEIPKYLGTKVTILNMSMVVGTSGKADNMGDYELGQLSGMSNTYDEGHVFTYHFKQHGYLFGVVTVRPYNTYENGIPKHLVKHSIDDYYKPEMAYFGPDIVRNYEIYSDKRDGKDDEMFGVRNYGDDLRYFPNLVTGQMRTNANFSQAYKTYSINYETRPLNNAQFIKQSEKQVDKTLTVDSATMDNFVFQCTIDLKMWRNLPKNPNAEQLIRL